MMPIVEAVLFASLCALLMPLSATAQTKRFGCCDEQELAPRKASLFDDGTPYRMYVQFELRKPEYSPFERG
jgi:hypothetical protein